MITKKHDTKHMIFTDGKGIVHYVEPSPGSITDSGQTILVEGATKKEVIEKVFSIPAKDSEGDYKLDAPMKTRIEIEAVRVKDSVIKETR